MHDGQRVPTLAPLWPRPPRAVIVGINPALKSVDAGHYFQGRRGTFLINQLQSIGIVPPATGEFDDRAMAAGIGFTDLVRRPTSSAEDLDRDEMDAGAARLRLELTRKSPHLILAVFKPPVVALLGPRHGEVGWQVKQFAGLPVFKLPAMQDGASHPAWAELGDWWRATFQTRYRADRTR